MRAGVKDGPALEPVGGDLVPEPDQVASVPSGRSSTCFDLEADQPTTHLGHNIDLMLASFCPQVKKTSRVCGVGFNSELRSNEGIDDPAPEITLGIDIVGSKARNGRGQPRVCYIAFGSLHIQSRRFEPQAGRLSIMPSASSASS